MKYSFWIKKHPDYWRICIWKADEKHPENTLLDMTSSKLDILLENVIPCLQTYHPKLKF